MIRRWLLIILTGLLLSGLGAGYVIGSAGQAAGPTARRAEPKALGAPRLISRAAYGNVFPTGKMHESPPLAWQEIDGARVAAPIAFQTAEVLGTSEVPSKWATTTSATALTMDHTLTWNTFVGGSGSDDGVGIALDGSGNVYISGLQFCHMGQSAAGLYRRQRCLCRQTETRRAT